MLEYRGKNKPAPRKTVAGRAPRLVSMPTAASVAPTRLSRDSGPETFRSLLRELGRGIDRLGSVPVSKMGAPAISGATTRELRVERERIVVPAAGKPTLSEPEKRYVAPRHEERSIRLPSLRGGAPARRVEPAYPIGDLRRHPGLTGADREAQRQVYDRNYSGTVAQLPSAARLAQILQAANLMKNGELPAHPQVQAWANSIRGGSRRAIADLDPETVQAVLHKAVGGSAKASQLLNTPTIERMIERHRLKVENIHNVLNEAEKRVGGLSTKIGAKRSFEPPQVAPMMVGAPAAPVPPVPSIRESHTTHGVVFKGQEKIEKPEFDNDRVDLETMLATNEEPHLDSVAASMNNRVDSPGFHAESHSVGSVSPGPNNRKSETVTGSAAQFHRNAYGFADQASFKSMGGLSFDKHGFVSGGSYSGGAASPHSERSTGSVSTPAFNRTPPASAAPHNQREAFASRQASSGSTPGAQAVSWSAREPGQKSNAWSSQTNGEAPRPEAFQRSVSPVSSASGGQRREINSIVQPPRPLTNENEKSKERATPSKQKLEMRGELTMVNQGGQRIGSAKIEAESI